MLKLWDITTGECLRSLKAHTGFVPSVMLSANAEFALSASDAALKLWDMKSGECLRSLAGHTAHVSSVSLSADRRFAISGSGDRTIKLWLLDWELEDRDLADWDEGAKDYLRVFLLQQTPYASSLPEDREPSPEEITLSLTREGKPSWKEEDFQRLLYTLGCVGYGWLRPEGVRRELEKMTEEWDELTSH
jgi:WD40 repeat protein